MRTHSYDGNTLMIAENVSDSTGLGLGVHTTINPATAEEYAVSDGQKVLLHSLHSSSIPYCSFVAFVARALMALQALR